MGVVIIDAAGLVVALDASAERLLACDGQRTGPGRRWSEVEDAAGTWLVARREAVPGPDGSPLSFAHLAPLTPVADTTEAPATGTRSADADYLDAVLECLDTGVMAFDAQMTPVVVNAALRTLHGYPARVSEGRWPGRPQVFNVDGSALVDEDRLLAMVLRAGEVRGLRRSLRNEKTGELRQVSVNARCVHDKDGTFAGVAMAVHDVHEAVESQHELARQANRDHLTQLLNRRGLYTAVAAGVDEHGSLPETVMVCDISHFKQLNDTFGHATGDEALRVVARVLLDAAGAGTVVARLGGDEFVVVGWDAMSGLEDRIHGLLEAHAADVLPTGISISCGTTHNRDGRQGLEALMGEADSRMYAGRTRQRAVGPAGAPAVG